PTFRGLFRVRTYRRGRRKNDRSRYVRHDPQCEDAETTEISSRKGVQKAEDRTRLRLEEQLRSRMVNARSGNVRSDAVDREEPQHEQDPIAQVRNAEDVFDGAK